MVGKPPETAFEEITDDVLEPDCWTDSRTRRQASGEIAQLAE